MVPSPISRRIGTATVAISMLASVSVAPAQSTGGKTAGSRAWTIRSISRLWTVGLFFLGGGRVDGHEVLPPGWTKAAATANTKRAWGDDEYWGYGYLWWTHPDESYEAVGIFGQSILIDPRET